MNDLIREFLVWSIGFAIVSAVTLLVGHLLASRARKGQAAAETAGADPGDVPKRRPAWGTALIVVFAYLLLLGPVLQGVSRTFRSDEEGGFRQPPVEASLLPKGNRSVDGNAAVSREGARSKGTSADCPCRSKQPKNDAGATEPSSQEEDSATIESGGLLESE